MISQDKLDEINGKTSGLAPQLFKNESFMSIKDDVLYLAVEPWRVSLDIKDYSVSKGFTILMSQLLSNEYFIGSSLHIFKGKNYKQSAFMFDGDAYPFSSEDLIKLLNVSTYKKRKKNKVRNTEIVICCSDWDDVN
jgi:hypothetical protein